MTNPAKHMIKDGRAVCTGDRASACHIYPECDCEFWDNDEETGAHVHPDVSHDECWMIPWIDATGLDDTADDDALDRRDAETLEFPDGQIELEWQGDYMTWNYLEVVTS